MKPVYVVADNILSPLGNTTVQNFAQVKQGASGIRHITDKAISPSAFWASAFQNYPLVEGGQALTPFEAICIASIRQAVAGSPIRMADKDTIFILSTTKGNISLIENGPVDKEMRNRISLSKTAELIASHFQAANKPLVVSNACISGVMAVILAKRLLESGKYKHAVITGADVISKFVVSGFQCLYAMSANPCRPFDKERDGINLGECAATIILTTDLPVTDERIQIGNGSVTNDANHISGPSRTGQELSFAVNTALSGSEISASDLSFISAHGTATVYNDEMESKAFSLSGLSDVPLHSLKGNYGHTLGAAGVVESILTYQSLREQIILPSRNYAAPGVSEKVTVNTILKKSNKIHALKTASGFGGCNAAIVYSRV